mgnify:CR=1 FL=1
MLEPFKLHKDLKLGVATAATQIEGKEENTNWYRFSTEKGNIKDGSTPLRANNHYELYKEDIALMKKMNMEIYRMGIEWARIEPKRGHFNSEAMKHYIDEIKALKAHKIDVLVTLHHFSNPLWFEDMGGFLNKYAVDIFTNFVNYVVTNLKGLVKEYVTINEANIYASNGYLFGIWPPKKKSMHLAGKVMKTLSLCHIESYKIIKKIDKNAKVGFANHMAMFTPNNPKNLIDRQGAKFFDSAFNDSINKAMATGVFTFPMGSSKKYKGNYIDFFGINYYTRNMVKGFKMFTKVDAPHNDLGWEISPACLQEFLERFHKEYGVDIYITENGTCDSKDAFRSKFIYDHLKVISNLDYVKRYYHWTFMDNWEWAEGESARFGLVECDFETQKRTIRPSGNFYSEIIKSKEITSKMIEKYIED